MFTRWIPLVLAIISISVFAQTFSRSGLESEQWRTLEYIIEDLPEDAKKAGVSMDRLRNKVELRIRQAGLTPVDGTKSTTPAPYVYIRLTMKGLGFNAHIAFQRLVVYTAGQHQYKKFAATWNASMTGQGHQGEFLVSAFDGLLDNFLNDYLAANQKGKGTE